MSVHMVWALYVCGACGQQWRVFVRVDERVERVAHACVDASQIVPDAVRRRIEQLGGV